MSNRLVFWLNIFLTLCFLFLPFQFQLIPNLGVQLSQILHPVNELICSFFGANLLSTYIVSDSCGLFATSLVLGLFTCLLSIVFYKSDFFAQPKITRTINYFLLYLLAYFLMRYGIDKLAGLQFYVPASNTLHTPLGKLSKDILYWSTMGVSPAYNYFIGSVELLIGILLLFPKTRLFALIGSIILLLNIFIINVTYGITVKYLSVLLIVTAFISLLNFELKKSKLIVHYLFSSFDKLERKSTFISLLFFIPFVLDLIFSYQNVEQKTVGKSYTILTQPNRSLFNTNQAASIKRLHIHPNGYLITEDIQQEFVSYSINPQQNIVRINKQFVPFQLTNDRLIWIENGDTLKMNLLPIHIDKLKIFE